MEEKKTQEKKISKHEFYFEVPLYEEIDIKELEDKFLDGDVDAYSAKNHIDTTYEISAERMSRFSTYAFYNYFAVELDCKRKNNDTLVFVVNKRGDKVTKIGQNPSIADIQFEKVGKKYDKVLGKDDLRNYKKAIGLSAHGVGAGSFVYLRRIFENLIHDTFGENKLGISTTKEEFKIMRMAEKVACLKQYLPKQLEEMKPLYGIISKGVHELTEEECLKYFPALRLSIELILDEKIDIKSKQERENMVKKTLNDIGSLIGKDANERSS